MTSFFIHRFCRFHNLHNLPPPLTWDLWEWRVEALATTLIFDWILEQISVIDWIFNFLPTEIVIMDDFNIHVNTAIHCSSSFLDIGSSAVDGLFLPESNHPSILRNKCYNYINKSLLCLLFYVSKQQKATPTNKTTDCKFWPGCLLWNNFTALLGRDVCPVFGKVNHCGHVKQSIAKMVAY